MVAEGRAASLASGLASGRLFGVSYYRRLYPKLIRARQLIAEGAIGRPLLAEANCHSWLEIEDREWLADPALAGGGPLYDIASHRIDAMNFLFGKPERACGLMSNAVHRMGVEDSATVLMQFPSGVHADRRRALELARGPRPIPHHRRGRRDQPRSPERAGAARGRPRRGAACRTRISTTPSWRTLSMPSWPTIQRAWRARQSRPVGLIGSSSRWSPRKRDRPEFPQLRTLLY